MNNNDHPDMSLTTHFQVAQEQKKPEASENKVPDHINTEPPMHEYPPPTPPPAPGNHRTPHGQQQFDQWLKAERDEIMATLQQQREYHPERGPPQKLTPQFNHCSGKITPER